MMLTASNKENTIKKSVKIIDDDVHLSVSFLKILLTITKLTKVVIMFNFEH